MRLNRFNPGSIKVRRGGNGGRPGVRAGGIGCGGIAIVLIGALILGVDPVQMLDVVDDVQQAVPQQRQIPTSSGESALEICDDNAYSMEACNALGSLNETWEPLFREEDISFETPYLQFIEGGSINTACGAASSAMGPFYCPGDETINIDVAFYDLMARQMGAGGDFARYYVMAHEYGHHVQKLTGLAAQVRSTQQQNPGAANQLQVRMELQADCYAGVWAGKNRHLIDPGDLEEGMRAANAIGDDTLMRNAGQRVNQESFTHGSSAQRMEWLRRGIQTGDEDQCDTFADLR